VRSEQEETKELDTSTNIDVISDVVSIGSLGSAVSGLTAGNPN